jgi:hypothetical protein
MQHSAIVPERILMRKLQGNGSPVLDGSRKANSLPRIYTDFHELFLRSARAAFVKSVAEGLGFPVRNGRTKAIMGLENYATLIALRSGIFPIRIR